MVIYLGVARLVREEETDTQSMRSRKKLIGIMKNK